MDSIVYLLNDFSLCTGAVIAPKVILTAKHCVLDSTADDLSVGQGTYLSNGQFLPPVQDIITTAGDEIEGKDIALLTLEEPTDLKPLPWKPASTLEEGDTVTLVGFGQQKIGPSGSSQAGVKMSTLSEIVQTSLLEYLVGGPASCFGDSGGPGLTETGEVFGVVSRGAINCNGDTIYTRTDSFSEMIAQTINATSPQQPEPDPPKPVADPIINDPSSGQSDMGAGLRTNSQAEHSDLEQSGFESNPDSNATIIGTCAATHRHPQEFWWLASLVLLLLRRRRDPVT